MKQLTRLSILTFLSLTFCWTALWGQEGSKKVLSIGEYKALVAEINKGYKAIDDLETFMKEREKDSILIAKLQKEVDRKEGVIVSQINKNKECYAERGNLSQQMKNAEDIISVQAGTIKRLGKPKRFGIGAGIGYGVPLSGGNAGPIVSVGINYSFIRF